MSEVKLNDDIVKALETPAKKDGKKSYKIIFFAGAVLQGKTVPPGFGVRVTSAGVKTFVLVYRIKGQQAFYKIGRYGKDDKKKDLSVLEAVVKARELRKRIDNGDDPRKDKEKIEKSKTVAEIIDDFVDKYVRDKERGLRTADAYESIFERLVKPRIGDKGIYDLDRGHVAKMVDWIKDEKGVVIADRARQNLCKCLSWYAERDPRFDFHKAIVRVQPRADAKARARTRVLSDDEIRIVWSQLSGTFGNMVKMLLLTGARRDEVASMRFKEIDADNNWKIPASRYKTKKAHVVPLPTAAVDIIEEQKKISSDYVLPSSANTAFTAFSKNKVKLDNAVKAALQEQAAEGVEVKLLPAWRLHDLRRTARTLLARIGVLPHIAKMVLGHALVGMDAVYNQHDHHAEKKEALQKLAAEIERIIHPLAGNVIAIKQARKRSK